MSLKIKRPVLRYHGGKYKLAKWIISHFPRHKVYVELFGGAASVLMQKQRAYAEVYNDKWDTVVNVFQILRDEKAALKLKKQLELTPFSRSEFNKITETDLSLITCPIEKARITIFRSFAGFGSASTNVKYATGFRANSNRSGSTPAHDWQSYPGNINSFVERLRGVVIENKDYADVIDQHDSKETLFYADPPYVHSTRILKNNNLAYEHEMTDEDHVKLCKKLMSVKGMVVVSGYNSDLYNSLYKGWQTVTTDAYADGAVKRTERLWISPSCKIYLPSDMFDSVI